jgi:hypothetical protein
MMLMSNDQRMMSCKEGTATGARSMFGHGVVPSYVACGFCEMLWRRGIVARTLTCVALPYFRRLAGAYERLYHAREMKITNMVEYCRIPSVPEPNRLFMSEAQVYT